MIRKLRKYRMRVAMTLLFIGGAIVATGCPASTTRPHEDEVVGVLDTIISQDSTSSSGTNALADSLAAEYESNRYTKLTESDFERVAKELDVEIAAIKAVVLIETGNQMKGFYAPGVPVVNFDNKMYVRMRAKNKGKGDKDAKVPEGLSGYGLKEWRQLTNARKVNEKAANMGTFWGMFQIGGFNYKRCGCEDMKEFILRMSDSEVGQLELFAAFIKNAGMLEDLRNKNWARFARKYNGASYARRKYHTKMAEAYKKFSN